MYNKRHKDELYAQCSQCSCEHLLAYWDEELECYIYLADEPPLCADCYSEVNESGSTEQIITEEQACVI